MSVGTPIDSAIALWPEGDLTDANEGTGSQIEIEGGAVDAELYLAWTAVSGTNPTLDVTFEVSIDSGANWLGPYFFGRQFIGTDEPASGQSRFEFSRPIFIQGPPPPTTPTTSAYQPDDVSTLVRLITAVTGTSTPTFEDFSAWLNTPVEGRTSARVN